jgi:hypothetical protein
MGAQLYIIGVLIVRSTALTSIPLTRRSRIRRERSPSFLRPLLNSELERMAMAEHSASKRLEPMCDGVRHGVRQRLVKRGLGHHDGIYGR